MTTDNRLSNSEVSHSVVRYVPTYVNSGGLRTLMLPAQGRFTFSSREGAQNCLDAIIGGHNGDRIKIWGENPQFEVRMCECWPVHFDPKSRWFD